MAVDKARLEELFTEVLLALGEDPTRDGLKDTPARISRFWAEFVDYDPGNTNTVFESVTADQMVVVSGIRVWSLCEHHLLPFWCDISIGYITEDKVLGLSKFARVAHQYAHKLQLQERLVQDIADAITEKAGTKDVAVLGQGVHLCMAMRGIRTPAMMTSSVMKGAFRLDPQTRREFLDLVAGNPPAT